MLFRSGALGGEDWFRLGDRDLALHVERTRRLRLGQTLSEVTSDICRRLGIGARVVPMSDDRVRTRVRGDAGWIELRFGDNSYFPHLEAARLQGIEPTVIRQPGIAVDIDDPVDLALFLRLPQSASTRTRTLLEELGVPALLARRGIA